ncbi:GPI-inositol-deacylase [Amylocystis lapponica]|nr:GPI-inositol-deacylase [Amylocystis lapponica]
MSRLLVSFSAFSALSALVFYLAGLDIVRTLSPQGCRMSWMSPSYVLQSAFDETWSPLAKRYSLWLYREVGWETGELHGSPVLFIPGNAGSSHQVRSIASSAARQYYATPFQVSPEFENTAHKALDVFALEFNEDLSAFHGPTLDAETAYAAASIAYILSLYPSPTSLIILAHSMGGAVATALLPHPNISAIITMSAPHTLPPARLDRRVDALYADNQPALLDDPTPILSLCGGATDLMVPSESCILPPVSGPYRRTVFTSALEGSWTGVGHREMVWCHQVRWRVARAALELTAVAGAPPAERGLVLDTWLRDGHTLPPAVKDAPKTLDLRTAGGLETLPTGLDLVLRDPHAARTYLIPFSSGSNTTFVLYVRGTIIPIAPRTPLPLRASVFLCQNDRCSALAPDVLKLVPNPVIGASFPVPDEGSDESEGVVVFEADLAPVPDGALVAVRIDDADGRGWIVGGFVDAEEVDSITEMFGTLFTSVSIVLSPKALRTRIVITNLLSDALLVYRLTPTFKQPAACAEALFPPLLQHTSHPAETHYYPLASSRPIFLHTHATGPYHTSRVRGLVLTVYSSGEDTCAVESLALRVDWWGTLGRWGPRYASAVASWAVGIVALLLFYVWGTVDKGGHTPSVSAALTYFTLRTLPVLLPLSFIISLLPLPAGLWLGNRGEALFAVLAPLLLLVATGAVGIVSGILAVTQWVMGRIIRAIGLGRIREDQSVRTTRNSIFSMGLVFALIFLLVPWQVAFLGCWIYHFYTCAAGVYIPSLPPSVSPSIPLIMRRSPTPSSPRSSSPPSVPPSPPPGVSSPPSTHNQNSHLLLLLTLLLPLAAPVLAVWVRTLISAGPGAPWGADHNVLCVAPALLFVERAGAGERIFSSRSRTLLSPRWGMLVLALVAFFVGPRATYVVSEVASGALGVQIVVNMVPWLRGWKWASRRGG